MNRNIHRRGKTAGALVTLITALALTGCIPVASTGDASSTAPSADAPTTPAASPSPTPTFETFEVGTGPDLTFLDGAVLAPGSVTHWVDGLADEKDWHLSSPDDGHGSWAYTSIDEACRVAFWQETMPDMEALDDVMASDFALAALLRAEPAELEGKISNGTFSHRSSGHGLVDNRYMRGTFDDGVSWFLASRGFAQSKSAVFVDLRCKSGDIKKIADFVWHENAVRVD